MRILFLDDAPHRHDTFVPAARAMGHEVIAVWSAASAIELLERHHDLDLILLDHDLADEHYGDLAGDHDGTGMEVVHALVELMDRDWHPVIVVHTWNHYRADDMVDTLEAAGYRVHRIAFAPRFANVLVDTGLIPRR